MLASRKMLGCMSATSLTGGEIAGRFEIPKSSVSEHVSTPESAGLVSGERRGQFIHYSLVRVNPFNTVTGYLHQSARVSPPVARKRDWQRTRARSVMAERHRKRVVARDLVCGRSPLVAIQAYMAGESQSA
jgi:DNA-binding transcriptional ArsR family regulator